MMRAVYGEDILRIIDNMAQTDFLHDWRKMVDAVLDDVDDILLKGVDDQDEWEDVYDSLDEVYATIHGFLDDDYRAYVREALHYVADELVIE